MAAPQDFKNHTRLDPAMHLFIVPILLVNLGVALYVAVHYRHEAPLLGPWAVLLALALLVFATRSRMNDLKVQDRIIRLEERLRLSALLNDEQRAHIDDLGLRQFVALRFASDEELPSLFQETLTRSLEPKAIKQRITSWRPDHQRV